MPLTSSETDQILASMTLEEFAEMMVNFFNVDSKPDHPPKKKKIRERQELIGLPLRDAFLKNPALEKLGEPGLAIFLDYLKIAQRSEGSAAFLTTEADVEILAVMAKIVEIDAGSPTGRQLAMVRRLFPQREVEGVDKGNQQLAIQLMQDLRAIRDSRTIMMPNPDPEPPVYRKIRF